MIQDLDALSDTEKLEWETYPIQEVNSCLVEFEEKEVEILRRYETLYHTILQKRVLRPLRKPLSAADINVNIQGTIVDYSVAYALQGGEYVNEVTSMLNYNILQSSLLLTVCMPLFISLPSFDDDGYSHIFSGTIGAAAFCQTTVIIGTTILSAAFSRPYTDFEAVIIRIQSNIILVFIFVINYASFVLTICSMLIVAFERSDLDGLVQLYIVAFIVALFGYFIYCFRSGNEYQDNISFSFYSKYCQPSGRLKLKYLDMVYGKKKQG